MSLLTRLRRFGGAEKSGAVTVLGDVVVVHAGDGGTDEARALAATLPADPEHQVVVADLPHESPVEAWESLAASLPRDQRPVRLVPGRLPLEFGASVAPWLAERLGRPVLAPHGRVHQGAAGALFVDSGPQTGWGWFRPKQPAVWAAKRFPRPGWESPALAEVVAAGKGAVAEPLPAGMWIHPAGPAEKFARERLRLIATVACQPGTPVIVLGSNEVPGLTVADVAAFWRTLPAEVRAAAWFVPFGGVTVPEGRTAGSALAAAIGSEVLCYNGIPLGSPDAPEVFALRPDGERGWQTFARGFAYRPGEARPRLRGHRVPAGGLSEIVPGVYRYTPDVVVEIVRAGLWMRSLEGAGEDTGGAARSVPVDPERALVLYEATDPARADRLRAAADELVKVLEPGARVLPLGTAQVDRPGELTTRLPTVVPLEDEPLEDEQSERTVWLTPRKQLAEVTTRLEVSAVPAAVPETEPDDGPAETALPFLSRVMETMVMEVPASVRAAAANSARSGLSARLDGRK